jgi:hypothetical protein
VRSPSASAPCSPSGENSFAKDRSSFETPFQSFKPKEVLKAGGGSLALGADALAASAAAAAFSASAAGVGGFSERDFPRSVALAIS